MKENTNQQQHFFAVDLGATSGRTIIGTLTAGNADGDGDGQRVEVKELTRFDNPITEVHGHFYWNLFALYGEIIRGLRLAAQQNISLTSIGIDTWGVDFVCIGNDGAVLRNPLSYRDPHTEGIMEDFFSKKTDRHTVYQTTGIQFMAFNSLFQLYAMKEHGDAALANAQDILFLPDALSYLLTGEKVCEYTIASTSQLLDPRTKELSPRLLDDLGLRRDMFGRMVAPATQIGTLTEEVQRLTGLGPIPVIAVAGHDTASAVAAVPASDEHFAYLSSGTWSLMGIETKEAIINDQSYLRNFTNEGGIEGTTRFLKNICGMWIYEQCRREWTDAPKSHAELIMEAIGKQPFRSLINPDDECFANPPSMVKAIQDYCRDTHQHVPQGYAEICRCIFDSLALRYRQVFDWLKEFTSFPIERLHIIGGGSLNNCLNQFTANSLGLEVLAGPQECTAIGNIMLQAKAAGAVSDIWAMRRVIARSVELKHFEPTDRTEWNAAYERYTTVTKSN